MYWTEKNEVVVDVERSVMVWSEAEGRMNMFEVPYVVRNAQTICNCSLRAHCSRTCQVHSRDEVHGIVEDELKVRLRSISSPQANEHDGNVDGDE